MLQSLPDALRVSQGLGFITGPDPLQTALRAVVIYSATLAIVRVGSKRLLGRATLFDMILGFMIGSVMSRGVNGTAGLAPTLAAGTTLVAMHWLLGVLSYRASWFGNLVKGRPVLLVEEGRLYTDALRGSSVSRNDLAEALRLSGQLPDPSRIRLAYLERNGAISVIPGDPPPRVVDVAVADGVQVVRIELG